MREKLPIEDLQHTRSKINRVESQLDGKGRVTVRSSGPSALLRDMVEGEDEGKVRSYAEQIIAAAREDDLLA